MTVQFTNAVRWCCLLIKAHYRESGQVDSYVVATVLAVNINYTSFVFFLNLHITY